jgi:protein-disulfide isomerase
MAKRKSTATRRAEAQAAAERAAAIREEQQRLERRRRTVGVSAAVLVVLALIFGVAYAVQSSRDTTGQAATPPRGSVNYGVPVGAASAPATVSIYEDFMCPVCGALERRSRGWLQKYLDQGKVRVSYHVISILDRASNGAEYSTRSANAMAAVLDTAGVDVAKQFHDLLYEHQPSEGSDGLTDQQLIDLAVKAGASRDAVTKPIETRAFEQWVKNGTDAASKLKDFQGTPTAYVDGKKLGGYQTMDQMSALLRKAIDAEQIG